jgi:hypothetical protein
MDFKKSLSAGLEAAKKARYNKDEINSTIKDLSQVINEFSNGLISLEITSERKKVDNSNMFSAMASAMGTLSHLNSYKDYQALSLIKNSNNRIIKRELAEWSLNDSVGYPCVISYNKQDVRCSTRDTLAKALNDLMSDAQSGESLLELMEMPDEDLN